MYGLTYSLVQEHKLEQSQGNTVHVVQLHMQLEPLRQYTIFHSFRYPLLLGKHGQQGIRRLPDTFTMDRQCKSNTRHSDLKSNAHTRTDSVNRTPDILILSPMPCPLDYMQTNGRFFIYTPKLMSHVFMLLRTKFS